MNRDHVGGGIGLLGKMELITQAAFHEAGHAAAIYLRNRYHDLPQISFRIFALGGKQAEHLDNSIRPFSNKAYPAKLEGGLLVENQVLRERDGASSQAVLDYQQACAADVVNLMVGPLAEARHVAQRDGEYINQHLVNYDALKHYGGKSDQEKIEKYLDDFRFPQVKKAEKLKELHSAAFSFIDQTHHWRAISRLANYIVESEKDVIAYEETIAILEAAMGPGNWISGC
jgi:hypothetical protein